MKARWSIQKRHTSNQNPPHAAIRQQYSTAIILTTVGDDHEALWISGIAEHLESAGACFVPQSSARVRFCRLTKGAQYAPAYLAVNPTGRTPTLVDGDFKLWESNAILQYIAGKSATPLWPNDARTRADITRWQCWELAHWSAQACGPLTFERLVKKFVNLGVPDETAVAKATEAFNKEGKVLDAHLMKQKYLVGQRADDCRFHSGRTAVPCPRSGNAGGAL